MRQIALYILILLIISTTGFWNCKKARTVVTDTTLVENPGDKKPAYVANGKVKRGEFVKVIEEKSIDEKKYLLVQVEGVTTKGWIDETRLREGKLESVAVISDSDLYLRPTEKSDKSGRAKAGQKAFKISVSGEFVLIQYPGKEAYIHKSNLGSVDSVVRSVVFPGIGKAIVNASSQYISGEGRELDFDPRNLFDSSLATAWCEGKSGDNGLGESVSLSFDDFVTFTEVSVVNGFTKSEDLYKMNNRVASLNIVSDGGSEFTIDLLDGNLDYQTIPLHIYGKNFKFSILKIYKGKDTESCMSEIRLLGYSGREGGAHN